MPIKDAYNNTCAAHVLSVIPDQEAVKMENKTLNGKVHIQTLGDPIDLAVVRCLSTYTQWQNLTDAAAKSVPVYVDFEGDQYDGVITGNPSATIFTKGSRATRLYQVNFTLYL